MIWKEFRFCQEVKDSGTGIDKLDVSREQGRRKFEYAAFSTTRRFSGKSNIRIVDDDPCLFANSSFDVNDAITSYGYINAIC